MFRTDVSAQQKRLPLASVLDNLKLYTQVTKEIETKVLPKLKKDFESFRKREAKSYTRTSGRLLRLNVSRFLKASESIATDVFEHSFVYCAQLASKQGEAIKGLNREDVNPPKGSKARKIPRLSPKRAHGKLKKLMVGSLNSNANRKLIKNLAKQNAKALRDFSKTEVERLARTTSKALRLGLTTETYAKQIQHQFGVTQRRAFNIARDQTMRLNSQMTERIAKDNGAKQFTWIHSGNPNGREEHIARDGKTYSYSRPPSEMPGDLPNCQCTQEPRFKRAA